MKARIKFQKYGAMKFVGHLDVMRYFQKAFRRADIDNEYTKGFSPHQIMSFASPLGVGVTSDAEYMDVQLLSSDEPQVMIDRINRVLTEGFRVIGFKLLKDREENQKAVTAMSLTSSSDYLVFLKKGYSVKDMDVDNFRYAFLDYISQDEINIIKKTKTKEKIVNIKPMISRIAFDEKEYVDKFGSKEISFTDIYDNCLKVYLQLNTGSVSNLKPELVIEAFCNYHDIPFYSYAWQVHRLEIYTREEKSGRLISLDKLER